MLRPPWFDIELSRVLAYIDVTLRSRWAKNVMHLIKQLVVNKEG